MKNVLILMILGSVCLGAPWLRAGETIVSKGPVHLRSGSEAEWGEYEDRIPNGDRLSLEFDGPKVESESTLFIQQDDVRHDWTVELNGRRLGKLHLMEEDLVNAIKVPAGTLVDGKNILSINPPAENDDVFIGEISLVTRPLAEAISGSKLDIRVVEEDSLNSVPCRITIVNRNGALAALRSSDPSRDAKLAIRPGVVYTGDGVANVSLRPGDYTVYASRGPEYSVATNTVRLLKGDAVTRLDLSIRRELRTPGWVSCDTHVHTFTHSRHGDATINERMLTLAGEGIELPVSTDHNLHIDYAEAARAMNVNQYFTPITGNEVTTAKGHFNVFPMAPDERVPDFRVTDWPRLMGIFRGTPGLKVVVLNHPRNIHNGFQPFASTNFNAVTGDNLRGFDFTFDAMEVLNSSAQQSDYMLVYRDWFALLNHGYRIVAVGSSDGHDVSRYIVGQGRTYIRGKSGVPGAISVDEVLDNLLAGRALVSMGLQVNMTVNDRFQVGDLATECEDLVKVKVDVRSPGWMTATNISLFANGLKIREQVFGQERGSRSIITQEWLVPRPTHDVHLVAMATGPGVTAPCWAIPRPYQPTSKKWTGRVIGSTNPIWVDADGDGEFSAARKYAQTLVDRFGVDPISLIPELQNVDESIAAQVAGLCQSVGADVSTREFDDALRQATDSVRRGFLSFIATQN